MDLWAFCNIPIAETASFGVSSRGPFEVGRLYEKLWNCKTDGWMDG